MSAQRQLLAGHRWHFQHGPMDLLLWAEGTAAAVAAAHEAAWQRFAGLLDELVAELPLLRCGVEAGPCPLRGPVARRMWQACQPLAAAGGFTSTAAGFITPMAAVAGAVAQELIAFYQVPGIRRAFANNGGDIALHLAGGEALQVGLVADIARGAPRGADAQFRVHAAQGVLGVATSGWRGRSFSLGIADSVSVLAPTAAMADAAATVIANAVNTAHGAVKRQPASELRDDSDLGARLVTVDVPPLPADVVREALQCGVEQAQALRTRGLIGAALLACQDQYASVAADESLAGLELACESLP